ncbi:MAG: helix-turn-helix transcriptional regulator [Acidobacteria bacterium]|nr:helix-turn-helix transcriptional regulator [Acidobacteriota bacterium]
MGRASRRRPKRLAEKLLTIRQALNLSQSEMAFRLGCEGELTANHISKFELDRHEPSLPVLLSYARMMGVSTDVLIDDKLDLPAKLLSATKSNSIRRSAPRGRR